MLFSYTVTKNPKQYIFTRDLNLFITNYEIWNAKEQGEKRGNAYRKRKLTLQEAIKYKLQKSVHLDQMRWRQEQEISVMTSKFFSHLKESSLQGDIPDDKYLIFF